jgi:N-acetylmuramoyl-L-alanine amidase
MASFPSGSSPIQPGQKWSVSARSADKGIDRRPLGMIGAKRIFAALVVLSALLCGCQTADMDQDLPPIRLSGPVILPQGSQLASAQVAVRPMSPVPALSDVVPAPAAPKESRQVEIEGAVPRAWIPQAPLNHWTWIIIHHSDSDYGSAAIIDRWHRARGFDELGYHFVIGNGTDSGDGQIEVGPRWVKQKWGAHDNALDNRFNISGIGICLVGDFNKTHPTMAQRRSLIRLVVYLMRTYRIPLSHVLGHGETKDTQCPGRYLRASEVRAAVTRILSGESLGEESQRIAEGGW